MRKITFESSLKNRGESRVEREIESSLRSRRGGSEVRGERIEVRQTERAREFASLTRKREFSEPTYPVIPDPDPVIP